MTTTSERRQTRQESLRQFSLAHPVVDFVQKFAFGFTLFAVGDWVWGASLNTSSYGRHLADIAVRALFFGTFFFLQPRWKRKPTSASSTSTPSA